MIGQRISGRYQIIETIGGGGMANVYKALDVILDRHVAVKVLQPQFSEDEQFIKRFRREAQAATSLAHPNVVNIYDVGEEGNTYYIVMEYVEGQTLKELIQSRGPLPVEEAVDYMEQMLAAIAHAHANQLIHRDIKPHNILISHDGVLKVTDFGIARAISSATITHTNSIMGSVHYLSPEQARGGHVTYKSDIYSLGIVLYEMVTGVLPFSGDTAVSIAIKHLQNDVPSAREKVPSLPQSIENIIRKATIKDPLKRYENVLEMEEDLATALSPERLNEPSFIEDNDDEATKAIPIIRDIPDQKDLEKTVEIPPPPAPMEPAVVQDVQESMAANKKKGKRKKWLMIIIITLVLFFGSFVAAFALLPNLFRVDEVEVPSVVEMSFEEAQDELTSLKLIVEREEIESDTIPQDHIVRQNPQAGSMVKENATVTLYVSTGVEEVELDNYVGLPIDRAETLLNDLNYTVERIPRETNDQSPGIVLSQNPEEGTMVVAEETTIYLTYSIQSQIRLRNLEGEVEDSVRSYLNEVELVGRFNSEHSQTVEKGKVIRQSPPPYTMLEKGDEVNIIISNGPEPQREPERPAPAPAPPPPEEEPTRLYEVNQQIVVEEEDRAAGRTYDVRIVYRDANTNGEDRVIVEETINETKEYTVPLRVSPSQGGSFEVYVNGELAHNSNTYTYER
ncbi:Stk1 family PASTA domain-containing Ser/Thr kinase [Halalkalibacter nanhaiisediminis]|uniref:Serine/threonine-protein kinase PrkC n=1 Tax=Halalkalibacter nanhaiisediminis TaxID=688079 RepID=A0A562QEJ5_9BACI|nr:Stk1 family PASTA domain-containing Ser/Thr kinase [Halalkalibacter nanhaiisediminis]TWI55113.1 serine/threonine protein kinase [Halalkalibacter nanhaiisediminis]